MKNTELIIALLAVAVIVSGGGVIVYQATRGLRNNNPGNLEDDGTHWDGMTGTDGPYIVFQSAAYGIRAMARSIQNAVAIDGIPSTVSAIVTHWAPPSQNDTVAYIQDVDDQMGLAPGNDAVDLSTELAALIAAMIRHENGLQPYSAALIRQGISMAA